GPVRRLQGHRQRDQGGNRDQSAEEEDWLWKPRTQRERSQEQPKSGGSKRQQDDILGVCRHPGSHTGTSSGRSQAPPTSLLIWVAKTSEALSTARGGPPAESAPSAISSTPSAVLAGHSPYGLVRSIASTA